MGIGIICKYNFKCLPLMAIQVRWFELTTGSEHKLFKVELMRFLIWDIMNGMKDRQTHGSKTYYPPELFLWGIMLIQQYLLIISDSIYI